MTKTGYVGGRHKSKTNNIIEYEKLNLRLKNFLKLSKELVIFVVVTNHKFLLSK